jgi:hypothetical protein
VARALVCQRQHRNQLGEALQPFLGWLRLLTLLGAEQLATAVHGHPDPAGSLTFESARHLPWTLLGDIDADVGVEQIAHGHPGASRTSGGESCRPSAKDLDLVDIKLKSIWQPHALRVSAAIDLGRVHSWSLFVRGAPRPI